jgi:hypothetical protein
MAIEFVEIEINVKLANRLKTDWLAEAARGSKAEQSNSQEASDLCSQLEICRFVFAIGQ